MIPSVTQILSPWSDFSGIRPEVLEKASVRGTRIHLACSNYASGFMIPSFTEGDEPYFQSFQRWFDSTVEKVISVEMEYRCPVYQFQGHPDLVCVIKGDTTKISVVDLKTPRSISPSWRLQLAAYAHLTGADRCFSLRLSPEGKQAIADENTDWKRDLNIFLNALSVWRFYHEK